MSLEIQLLEYNRSFIITEMINWMKVNHPTRTSEFEKCYRDLSYIIDAFIADIQNNSDGNTIALGNCFWKEHPKTIQIKQVLVEKSVHNKTVDIINNFILSNLSYPSTQSDVKQMMLPGTVNDLVKQKITQLNLKLSSILDNGPIWGVDRSFNLMSTMMSRRSFRSYKDTPLPTKHVNMILEAASLAPSKNRLYPYQITALTQTAQAKEIKQSLLMNAFFDAGSKNYHPMCLAPLLLIYAWVPVAEQNMWGVNNLYPEARTDGIAHFNSLTPSQKEKCLHTAIADIHISASFALLMAESLGYESHFVECFRFDVARDICGINKNYMPKIAVAIGKGKDIGLMQNDIPVIKDGVQVGKINEKFQTSQPPKLTVSQLSRKI